MNVRPRFGLPAAALIAGLVLIAPALAAPPPPQPAEGAGGIGDKAATIVKRGLGHTGAATFAFYKSGPAPQEGRPVAVLLPAWGAPNPQGYGAWIDHLARNGWLVLVPRVQEVNRTRPADATANAQRLLKAALAELDGDAEAKPDTARVALIGHLAGAPLAANLAATAAAEGLPAPKLVFALMPGGIASNPKSRGIPLADLDAIPAETLLVTVIGDRDARAADAAGRRILRAATNVAADRKLFVRALSDDHGFPALTATLTSPAGVDPAYDADAIKLAPEPKDLPKEQRPPPFKWSPDMALSGEQTTLVAQIKNARADSLDYHAYWRTFDLAAAAAFSGRDAQSLKSDPRFSDMQRWGDGWPVKRLSVEVPRPAAPASTGTAGPRR